MDLSSIRDLTAQQLDTTTAMNINKPANLNTGDVVFCVFEAYQPTAAPTGIPSGFSQLLALTIASEMGGYVYAKVATGSEPSTYNFTWGTIGGWSARAFVITGSLCDLTNFPTSLIVDSDVANNTGTSVTVPELTGLAAGALLLGIVASRGTGATITSNGSVMTGVHTTDAFSTRTGRLFHQAGVTGASGTRVFDVSASTVHTAGLLALKAAPGLLAQRDFVLAIT